MAGTDKTNLGSMENWRDAVLSESASIKETISNLDDVAIQIVLVCDAKNILIGTVSDGDIRRGLLKGLNLNSSIESVIHRNPLVVPETLSRELVLELMAANKVKQIPIVDQSNRVVGLHLWDEMTTPAVRGNVIVIMAGGKGTRLRPYTENCPKPMLAVGGKPLLEHIILRAKSEGFEKFVVSINYLGHMIEDYFGSGAKLGVRIEYLREDSPLGTAGALSLLSPIPDRSFVVTNGDVMTDVRYGELIDFHERHKADATMAVRLHEWQHPFGVVQMRGVEIVGFEEKPIYRCNINAGIYAMSPTTLKYLARGEPSDMPPLFERLQARGLRTIAYPMHEPWLDVGRPADLDIANKENANSKVLEKFPFPQTT